jgi:hypothetical protein
MTGQPSGEMLGFVYETWRARQDSILRPPA